MVGYGDADAGHDAVGGGARAWHLRAGMNQRTGLSVGGQKIRQGTVEPAHMQPRISRLLRQPPAEREGTFRLFGTGSVAGQPFKTIEPMGSPGRQLY
jgi:hypothetical protein